MIRIHRALTAALTAAAMLGALAACGSTPAADTSTDPAPARTHAATPAIEGDTDAPNLDRQDLTKAAISITWDASTDTDKDSMCEGIDLFGPEWAADQMRDGAADESLDWDYAAQIIEGKCAVR